MNLTETQQRRKMLSEIPSIVDRDGWYRIEERENQAFPVIEGLRYGDWIEYDRIIIRAGYYVQPTDMDSGELMKLAIKEMVKMCNYNTKYPSTVLNTVLPFDISDRHLEGPINEDMVKAFIKSTNMSANYVMKKVLYKIRGAWTHNVRSEHRKNLRTFWYKNVDGSRQVRDLKRKVIGHAYSANNRHYSSPRPTEPPSFETLTMQRVYHIGGSYHVEGDASTYEDHYVHPLDIKNPERYNRWK